MKLLSFLNSENSAKDHLQIQQSGQRRIDRMAQSGVGKSSLWSLAEVGWTAGPVTFLAAQGGYYLGFGSWLPNENLIFFVGYTVLMGVIAVLVKFIYKATKGQVLADAKEQLLLVIGGLPDFIFSVRDLTLSRMEPESRRYESARILLQKSDLGPQWLSLAVNSIIDSPVISRAVADIEIYWRAGMYSRIHDINQELSTDISAALASLEPDRPRLARLLEQRLHGKKNTLRSGVEREPFFIERIFSAIEEDNEDIMGLSDVEEVLTLAFELLSGRRIPMLVVNCVGSSQMAIATEKLEKERSKYRIARARGYSQLLALANFLSDSNLLDYSTVAERLPSRDLLQICLDTLDQLCQHICSDIESVEKREVVDMRALKLNHSVLIKALELYQQAYQSSAMALREHADFLQDINSWQRVNRKYADANTKVSVTGKRGLHIVERQIQLSDADKITVVKKIAHHFNSNSILSKAIKNRSQQSNWLVSNQQVRAAKQLAIDLALALDPCVFISLPEVQRAIYTSNAVDLGSFEPGLSTTTKVGWGESVAKEVQKDMVKASGQLAQAIHRYYGICLGDEELDFMHQTYGMDKQYVIDYYVENEQGEQSSNVFEPRPPLMIPADKFAWRKTLILYREHIKF
ncbi:hypothetical protein [Thalassotalea sp. ND16A]|uniref:hypothetical protein n=1 Tax=Thalassotalea sp. ND16A TaxID=1535422 RepID=UPI00051A885A|nr:hypothetical protein [Thalassotalea sp. ND16A]KGK00316.1 hypothetical protein ND16A_3523 [Thalassotalea sp. ND16A]